MDVIASVQAGVRNVVATSGTALTDEHLRILYRYTPNIIFAFDADTAGLATAKKAYEMAIAEGMNVKMVSLDKFKDPGEMAAADPKLWVQAVADAKPVIDWYFQIAFRGKGIGGSEIIPQEKKEIAKELLPIIKKIPDTIEQAHYVGLLAKRLGIAENIIFDALNKIQDTRDKRQTNSNIQTTKLSLSPEEILIGLLISNPEKINIVAKKIAPEDIIDKNLQQIYNQMLLWYDKGDQKGKFRSDSQKAELLVLEVKEKYPEATEALISDLIRKLKEHKSESVKQHFAEAIKAAEAAGDREKLKALIKEFQDAISK